MTSVFEPHSKPYGLSYADWTAKWWQWVLQIPTENNPINDNTGKNCAINQNGPVWFLAGTGGGSADRTCTVPAGKAILFPVLTTECSYAEDTTLTNPAALRVCAIGSNQGGAVKAEVDGITLTSLNGYRVQSPLFNFIFPKSNIFGAKAGPTQAVSDGWFIILQPLTLGNHIIHFAGSLISTPATPKQSYVTQATYHLTIK